MIGSVAYFPSQCAQNSHPVMLAAKQSLSARGIQLLENSMDADCALIWSVLWSGRMINNRRVYEHYRSHNRPVIIIDVGTLIRGITWKISINNINALGYYGHEQDLDFDRPKKLGLELGTSLKTNPAILIASQHRSSLQTADIDLETWISIMYSELRKHTDRPVLLRPHPRCALATNLLPKQIQVVQPTKIANSYDSYDFVTDYHAIVNYNSGPGILAALAGTPPIVHASSLAGPVSISIDEIEKPYEIDRSRWFVSITHTEYTIAEIQQGLWLKRLGSHL